VKRAALLAALLWSPAFAIPVDIYQVLPNGIYVPLGQKDIQFQDDVTEMMGGTDGAQCRLLLRDDNLNGIPEAPGLLQCIFADGREYNIPVESSNMENKALGT